MTTREPKTKAERLETRWAYRQLRTHILSAYELHKPGVAHERELPTLIDAGIFGTKALECLRATEADPDRHEFGTHFLYDAVGRTIRVPTKLQRGEKDSVDQIYNIDVLYDALKRIESSLTPEQFWALKRGVDTFDKHAPDQPDQYLMEPLLRSVTNGVLGVAHSHPDTTTFSYLDAVNFLTESSIQILTLASGNCIHALLTTRETNWLTQQQAQEQMDQWMHEMVTRWEQAVSTPQMKSALSRDTEQACTLLRVKLSEQLLCEIAKQYHIAFYKGTEVNALRRVV